MGRFFHGNDDENEKPEDFVLYNNDGEDDINVDEKPEVSTDVNTDGDTTVDENLEETRTIDVTEVSAKLSDMESGEIGVSDFGGEEEEKQPSKIKSFVSRYKAPVVVIAAVLVVTIIAALAVGIVRISNPLYGYIQTAATKENIVRTMEVEGTVAPGEKREITSIVVGKVLESKYDVGDEVKEGDILYKLDDTEAKLSLERAQNELDKANNSPQSSSAARIIAPVSGTISNLSIRQGSHVTAGAQVGTITNADGATTAITSYVSGDVTIMSANVGRTVQSGQIIASVESEYSNAKTSEYDKKSGEIDVQSAQRAIDNYTITSPVNGVVIEKNVKKGDNIGVNTTGTPMMVVLDTSSLSLTVKIEESRVREVERGQKATITTESLPNSKFTGTVTYVSSDGVRDDSGNTVFDVNIRIDDPGELKSGMKVKCNIILASANNVTAVPERALMKSDGQNALVLVKNVNGSDDENISASVENQAANPDIKVPNGCRLVNVRYGVSDGLNVRIYSGISVGDIVVYNPKEKYGDFIQSTIKPETEEQNKTSDYSTKNKTDKVTEEQVKKELDKYKSGI